MFRSHCQDDLLAFTGSKALGFLEGPQFYPGHLQPALRCGHIQLHHFPACGIAGVGDPHGGIHAVTCKHLNGEGGIAQSKAKGIIDLLGSTGNRLKVAITHENIVGVANIVLGLIKIV